MTPLGAVDQLRTFAIRSNDEYDDEGERLWWSNEDGWVDAYSATEFTARERDSLSLPWGNTEWVAL